MIEDINHMFMKFQDLIWDNYWFKILNDTTPRFKSINGYLFPCIYTLLRVMKKKKKKKFNQYTLNMY